jgi:transposase
LAAVAGAEQHVGAPVARAHPQESDRRWTCPQQQACPLKKYARRIAQLERENKALRARLLLEQRRQFKANKQPQEDVEGAADTSAPTRKKKKRGAPVGHIGWFRRVPDRIDRTVAVPVPGACPYCGSTEMDGLDQAFEHVQEDIAVPAQPVVTKYVHGQARCRRCGRKVRGRAPDELPGCPIGPAAKAVAVWFRHVIGMSSRKVQRTLTEVFGMALVPASAMQFGHVAAAQGAPIYAALREAVKTAPVAHADETGWREDGRTAWVWFAGTPRQAIFHIAHSRSSAVASALLGARFPGTLVTDDYAAYHAVNPARRQACVSHLVTRAKKLVEELRHGASQYLRQRTIDFCTSVMVLLSDACAADKRLVAPSARRRAAKHFMRDLRRLCTMPAAVARVDTFRQRILTDLPHIFTFLTTPNVPPTNNFAEQSIRHIVIFRKTSFGTRSAQGSTTLATLASLVLSVKLQNGNPLAFLRDLLVGNFDAAYRAVFPDTS